MIDSQVLLTAGLILIPLATIPALIAKKKGRNFFLWYLYAYGFFSIAFIHVLLIPKKVNQEKKEPRQLLSLLTSQVVNYSFMGCPLDFLSYKLELNNLLQTEILTLNFFAKEKDIYLDFKVKCYNDLGMFLGEETYLDFQFSENIKVELNNGETTKVDVDILNVKRNEEILWTMKDDAKILYDIVPVRGVVQEKLKSITNEYAFTLPSQKENYWVCTCSKANDQDTCAICGMNKEELFAKVDKETLVDLKNEQIRYDNLSKLENKKAISASELEKVEEKSQSSLRFLMFIGFIILMNIVLMFLL